jgi:hypothetical protein
MLTALSASLCALMAMNRNGRLPIKGSTARIQHDPIIICIISVTHYWVKIRSKIKLDSLCDHQFSFYVSQEITRCFVGMDADSMQGDGHDIAVSGIRVPDFIHGWESQ